MDWKQCTAKRIVKSIQPDIDMVRSLKASSENKFASQEKLELTPVTAGSKVSLAYDSVRELLEALALQQGYKIYNHECYAAFLKEILQQSLLGDIFDEVRKLRNSINYYGKEISPEEAGPEINKMLDLRQKIWALVQLDNFSKPEMTNGPKTTSLL